jgi:hypothetical protein
MPKLRMMYVLSTCTCVMSADTTRAEGVHGRDTSSPFSTLAAPLSVHPRTHNCYDTHHPSFFPMHRSHSISFTRAQGIPKYKIGFGRGKGWESWGSIG